MRFALMLEPQQGLSYAEQAEIAQIAESAGFEALFRSDHYQSFPGPAGLPTTDALAVLAGLARDTSQIRLGALVSPVTFRYPGNLAKVALTIQEMSGGRMELGMGAGWNDDEHRQYGFPFPPIEVRAQMLEEQLAIVSGLWDEPAGWVFRGRHYSIEGSMFSPRPADVGGRPNLIVGGEGSPKSMRMAARFADEFNLTGADPDQAAAKFKRLDDACRGIARDPATLTRSAMVTTMIAADDRTLQARLAALLQRIGQDDRGPVADAWLAVRQPRWILGTFDQARERIRRYAEAGVQRLMLQDLLPWDHDMIREMGRELVRHA